MANLHDARTTVIAPLGTETRLRQACDELERRIRSGEPARVEEFLTRYPGLGDDPEQALDLIYIEYATRRELGESPPRAEYTTRFPQWRAHLERQFQLEEFVDEAMSTTPPSTPSANRFRVLRLYARGGIGQVMRAMDTELNREVAVKEIQPGLAEIATVRERFLREAEITGKLEHPGIVPVYGLGRDRNDRPFYAMRLVHGQSLNEAAEAFHQRLGSEHSFGLEFQKLLRRFLHVCETVAYAHSRGVIHRDIKPANILLGPFGETLLVDWGLARAIRARNASSSPDAAAADIRDGPASGWAAEDGAACVQATFEGAASPEAGSGETDLQSDPRSHWSEDLTQAAGSIVGTPAFMSPEQARGESQAVGPASDVYSLGATLYVLLTGQAPRTDSSVEEALQNVIAGRIPRPRERRRGIPRALEAICLKAMELRAEERYRSPRELADDLEHWLADEPVSAAREPLVARIARWGRRHRTRVMAGSLALLVITLVSMAAAVRINSERLRADAERIEANRQRMEAQRERNAANFQRSEADRRSARLAFARGVALTKSQEHGEGMLWFARALEHAPLDDAALRRVILTNLDAARHYLLNRRTRFALPGEPGRIAFSPDGKQLVATSPRDAARLWDVESGRLRFEWDLRPERSSGSGTIVALATQDDGSALIARASATTITMHWLRPDTEALAERPIPIQHYGKLTSAEFHPDGNLFAAGVEGVPMSSVRLHRVSDGAVLGELPHSAPVHRIVFRPHSREVATLDGDGTVRFWSIPDRAPGPPVQALIRDVKPASRRINTIAFTSDGKRMLAGDTVGTVSDWELESGRRLPDLTTQSGVVTAITVASDGQAVLAAWDTGLGRVWNLKSRTTFCEMLHLDRHQTRFATRPGTRQVLFDSEPRTAVLWDIPDPASLTPPLPGGGLNAIAFSPDGQLVVVAGDETARLIHAKTGKSAEGVRTMRHKDNVIQVAFRTDGQVLLTASQDGTARLWSVRDGTSHGRVMDHRSRLDERARLQAAAFSPNGEVVATGDTLGILRIWNGDSGEPLSLGEGGGRSTGPPALGSVVSINFSPSGDQLVAGYGGGTVELYDVRTGQRPFSARHGSAVREVSFSPGDGGLVLSAGNDDIARFWNAADGQPIGSEMRHRGQVFVARFNPAGRLAVTGGFDATVRLWKVPSGETFGEPMRHDGVVRTASFSRDGTRLLTCGTRDRTARLWDVETCLPLAPPLEHDHDVFAGAIHPDGDVAFTGRFWRLPVPLPDDPAHIALWVQLATQRTLTRGDSVEWLSPELLNAVAAEFTSRTGQTWSDWADSARDR